MSSAIDILGTPIHDIDFEGALIRIAAWQREGGSRQIATVNPEFIMLARRDPAFAAALRGTDLNVPDGVGVVWAARRLGRPLRERVGGADLMNRMCAQAANEGWPVFLLGAGEGVAERAGAILAQRHPGLRIAGVWAGSPRPEDEAEQVARIRAARPRLLFVAYGAPAQDLWLARNLAACAEGRALTGMGVGAAFDYLTGAQRRAPVWVQRIGLEWLYRLIQQPWRLRRQLALPRYAALVMLESLRGSRRQI